MPPQLTQVVSLDAHEDGSVAASFRDAEGADFTLLFPARRDAAGRHAGYGLPELQRHVPHRYTDKFTGDHHAYETREDTPLAWEDAARLLARMAPLVSAQAAAAAVHREMQRAAASQGAAPAAECPIPASERTDSPP